MKTIVWITKYALTAGIIKTKADVNEDSGGASYRTEHGYNNNVYGKNWWTCQEDALERAEEMKINKLKSLDVQISKISKIVFDA